MSDYITKTYPMTASEFEVLQTKLGDLTHFASWKLVSGNKNNNTTDDQDDYNQELWLALMKAVSYQKRQGWILEGLRVLQAYQHAEYPDLADRWERRTKHGANRQIFGQPEEERLERAIAEVLPEIYRPRKDRPLDMGPEFLAYAKAITWNKQKELGRKITQEMPLRSGMVSIGSEHGETWQV